MPKQKPAEKQFATITIRIPLDLKREVNDAACAEERSFTMFTVRALRTAVEKSKQEREHEADKAR